jgi:gliding motility-associated-like protein
LTATGGGTYSWSDGTSTVSSVAGLTVSDAGTYIVTVKGVNGCTATKDIATTKFTSPSPPSKITSSGPIEFCEGKDVILTAVSSQVGTYEWKKSGVVVGNLSTLTVSQSGVYEVTITVAGCKSASNDTTVVVNPAPATPSLANPAIFCSSENATIADLTLKMNITNLKWLDETMNELPTTTKLLHQGKYYAQQISALGCGSLSNKLVQVTINENPGKPAGSDSLFYCKNNNAKISDLIPQSSLGTTIEWSYLNVKQDVNNPLTEGKYKAIAIKDGCSSAGSHEVYVKIDDPTAPKAPTAILCANNQATLMLYDLYPNDNTKLFYATSSSNVALLNKAISNGETYYVKNKSKLGCLSESTQIIVNASSGPSISSNPYNLSPALCLIDKPTLDDVESKYNALPSTSGSMNWYLGQNDKLTDFLGKDIPIGSGDYWIALKDNNGCYSVKQKVTITVDAGVKPILKPIELCASKTYTVNELNISNLANPQGILSWYDTKNSPALSNSDNVDQSKEYWARYKKDPTACESSDSLKLIVTWIKFDNQVDLDNKNQVFCKSNITLIDNLNVEPYVKGTIGWFESLTSNDLLLNTDLLIEKDYFASEYKVISDGSNCVNSNRDKIQVTFYTTKLYPQVTASVCNKQNGVIQFDNVPTDYVLTWYNMSDTTKVDFVGNKYSKPLEQQSFKIMFTDKNNCLDSVYISMPACSVSEVPQIITPDNDGNNDTWDIGFATKYPKVQVFIFNRWGNEVYKSAIPYDDSWDGKYNNEYLPTGTYYYVIDKGNGDPKETGFVELVK